MIEIENITKTYGKKKALDQVNITFKEGIYGLLGPNGAGKSTLINILVTALAQTDGIIKYNGIDIRNPKSNYLKNLGFLPQNPRFYKNYTAEEFLKYMAALKNVEGNIAQKVDELLNFVNLSEEKKNKIGNFSGGMVQRIGVAQALINDPKIVIFDEPTAGLDPKERIRFRNLLSEISKNRTVILATHIVPDVEYIANKVILLNKGKIISTGTPHELMDSIENNVWELIVKSDSIEEYITKYNISNAYREKDIYRLRIVSCEQPDYKAINISPNLEDVFLHYCGKNFEDGD